MIQSLKIPLSLLHVAALLSGIAALYFAEFCPTGDLPVYIPFTGVMLLFASVCIGLLYFGLRTNRQYGRASAFIILVFLGGYGLRVTGIVATAGDPLSAIAVRVNALFALVYSLMISLHAFTSRRTERRISIRKLLALIAVLIATLSVASLKQGAPWRDHRFVMADADGMAKIDSSLFSVSFKGQSFQGHRITSRYLIDGCHYNHPIVKLFKHYPAVWTTLRPSSIQIGYDQNTRRFRVKSDSIVVAYSHARSELSIGPNSYSLSGPKRSFVVHASGRVEETTDSSPD